MKVRWSGTMLHKKRPVEGRFFAYKGTREAELRNSVIFTIPPNLPLRREAYGKCSTCSITASILYQWSALALLNAVRVRSYITLIQILVRWSSTSWHKAQKKLVILLDIQIFFITLYIIKYSSAYDTIDTS